MSDRLRWYATLVTLMLPVHAAAQEAPALERRIRQIDALRREAQAALTHDQAARREPLETLTVGSLVVVGRPENATLLRQATRIAWSRLDSLYGDAAQGLATAPMLFFLQGRPIKDATPAIARLQQVMAAPDATPSDVAYQLVRAGSAALRTRIDSALANWLGPQMLADIATPVVRTRAYVELVTAPSIAVRRCYAGAIDACGTALGIVRGDPVIVWYDASERRALVRQMREVSRMGLRPAINSCLQNESDAACLEVLHALQIGPPLTNDARQSLVRLALVSGGPHAFSHLSQSAGQPFERRLAVASGLPIDSLLRRWRSEIIAARPKPVTIAASFGWTALGWAVVFGLLALRSTRWR